MQGWGWQKAHHPQHVERVVEKIRRCFETGEPWEDTFPLRGKDGCYRWFLSRALPIRDEAGQVVRWFGTNTDVTEQRTTEEQLRQREQEQRIAEEALREADRRKDEFLATLAHELRNPLAPIRTGLHLLGLAQGWGPTETKAVAVMERQVSHMVRLIDDLLDVSRITRDQVELQRERLALRSVLDSAVEASRPLIDGNRHELVLHVPAEPLHLDADPTRLAHVLNNLLNNAAKYTPDGGRIELLAHWEGAEVVIRVSDTGAGISQEMLPKVFDLFTQVGKTLDRSQGGLGIGLALAKRLVEMHDGMLEVDSRGLGLGATFAVRLPLVQAVTARRVLVVDDNADAAESLTLMLELLGHEVRAAHSGLDALDRAREFNPSIVFCDIGMFGMNGHEAARRLREEADLTQSVLVALSGWGSDSDKRQTKQSGFDFHLSKPIDAAAVQDLLARSCPST